MKQEEFIGLHPGLKGKGFFRHTKTDMNITKLNQFNKGMLEWFSVDTEDIHETQIDKEKIREAIDGASNRIGTHSAKRACNQIKKELGLE